MAEDYADINESHPENNISDIRMNDNKENEMEEDELYLVCEVPWNEISNLNSFGFNLTIYKIHLE